MSLLGVFCLLCIVGPAFSQGTNSGTIIGRVTDPNGASVPGAAVKVTDVATGIVRDLTTNDEGEYQAATLKPGAYTVSVVAPNFKTTVVNVSLTGSETVRADAKLEVGSPDVTVSVTSEIGTIQTENPTISGSLSTRQLIELPRDSRDIYDFLYLNPNITSSAGGEGFKFIGAQSYGAAFSLDGQRSNGGIFGEATSSQPSLEAIEELTVLSNNFSAEYAGIANIRVITKRGTNQFHGSLFANNKNSALSAWSIGDKIDLANFTPNPANPDFPKPYFNLNEDGGSISGPVFGSKKTFFLGSYERRWNLTPLRYSAFSRLPSQRILNGDFSQIADSRKPLVPASVTLTPAEIAANTVGGLGVRFITIPQRLLNPTTRRLIDLYYPKSSLSAPVDSLGRLVSFAQNVNQHTARNLVTGRVDHDLTANDKIYAVYNYQGTGGESGAAAGAQYPAFGLRDTDQSNHTLSGNYTRVFSQSVVNELRGGFNKQRLFVHAKQTLSEFLSSIGFSSADIAAYGNVVGPAALDTFGQTELRITNFSTITNGGRSVNRGLNQELVTFGDTLTWIRGGHSFKGGYDGVRNRAVDGFTANRGNPRGRIDYTGTNLDPFANFLLGVSPNAALYVQKLRGALDASNWEHGFFFMDDWKVRPNVTLNLGVRYELITPFIEKNNLLVNFDPSYVNPANGRKGRFVVPTADVIPFIDPAMVAYGVVTADELGVSHGLINSDRNNIAPRLGIAWRLNESTVLRGGYGIFYPTSAAQGIRDALGSTPFNQGRRRRTRAGLFLGGWPGGQTPAGQIPIAGGSLDAASTVPSANLIPFDLQSPRVQQYNATLERELGWKTGLRVSYLGSRLTGLIGGVDLNLLPPSNTPYGTRNESGDPCIPDDFDCVASDADRARLPFPELGTFLLRYGNFGTGRSHAMQVEVNRRFANGFTFNASYTLLDQKGSGFDTANSSLGGTAYNQFNPGNDFATDAFVSRHRFVSYGVIDLPFGKGRKYGTESSKALDATLGGWQVSWNMFAKSGTGFTPFYDCGNCDPIFPGNIASDSLDAVGGFSNYLSYRPLQVGTTSPYGGNGTFFNSAAFAPPTVGADLLDNANVVRRNSLTGPSSWGANLGLRKTFRFTERMRLEVGADFNNVFNHPLTSPTDPDAAFNFTHIGTFFLDVDAAGRLLPITRVDLDPNFGRLQQSYTDEGIDNRRTVRLRLRFTF
jgi:hypothetical protein